MFTWRNRFKKHKFIFKGSQLNYINEIDNLLRPLEVIHEVSTPEQQLVVDILWSDPTDSD